ncbi:MAG: DNA polymerase III subunit beta [Bernardetiaceae bacterium]|nr:DNA polymerase III subunit beta [Bernardetiaceae bacterium]
MKFIASSSSLLKQLNALRGIVPSNPVIPILENFLFEIENGILTVTASDLQTSIIAQIDVEAEGESKLAVPAKMLLETLRNLPDQPVTFDMRPDDSYELEIQSSNGHYKLGGEDADDFPKPPEVKSDSAITLMSDVVADALGYTLFTVSNDDLKPAMNGVYMQLQSEGVIFVSTDSHKLVRYQRKDVTSDLDSSIIIPGKALEQLKSTLPDEVQEVQIDFNDTNAFFSFGNIRIISRLIDERFPDYENVIPRTNDKKLVISRTELLASLKRIVIYANKSTNQVRLRLSTNGVEVSAEDPDFSNEAKEILHSEYEGEEDFEIGFNARFLIEMLNTIHSDRVQFEFTEANRAALLLPMGEDNEDEDLLMLVMPLMLSNYY